MRDEFGEIDPDEIDTADAALPDAVEGNSEQLEPAVSERSRSKWFVPAAVASVLAVIAIGALLWQPWADDPDKVAFPTGSTLPSARLTEELVFDQAPADLSGAGLGNNSDDSFGFDMFADSEGYFFAEPGATFDVVSGVGDGVWAAFFSVAEDSEEAPDLTPEEDDATATVQGSPAVIGNDGSMITVDFGPIGGRIFSVAGSGMSRADAVRFAEAVGVESGIPIVDDSTVLGDMQPIGSVQAYGNIISLLFSVSGPGFADTGVVAVSYGEDDDAFGVASMFAVEGDLLPMLRFVLGGEEGITVNGLPAVAADAANNPFVFDGENSLSFVAWVEGGRLIMVTGPEDVDTLVALAETVRPATDDEWAEVVEVAGNTQNPIDDFMEPEQVNGFADLDHGVDADTGVSYTLSAKVDDFGLTICVAAQAENSAESTCDGQEASDLPLLTTHDWNGHQFVLAILDGIEADNPELRITLADGTVETHVLEEFGDAFPGPAVGFLLPDDVGTVELYNAGAVVATL